MEKTDYMVARRKEKRLAMIALVRAPCPLLDQYVDGLGLDVARHDPVFFGCLIAWNHLYGPEESARVALPIVALANPVTTGADDIYRDNALAHLALLPLIAFDRAMRFAISRKPVGKMHQVKRLVEKYLRVREAVPAWWDACAREHPFCLRSLYAMWNVKPAAHADQVLFKAQTLEALEQVEEAIARTAVAGLDTGQEEEKPCAYHHTSDKALLQVVMTMPLRTRTEVFRWIEGRGAQGESNAVV